MKLTKLLYWSSMVTIWSERAFALAINVQNLSRSLLYLFPNSYMSIYIHSYSPSIIFENPCLILAFYRSYILSIASRLFVNRCALAFNHFLAFFISENSYYMLIFTDAETSAICFNQCPLCSWNIHLAHTGV
jgi:hypothetical protein